MLFRRAACLGTVILAAALLSASSAEATGSVLHVSPAGSDAGACSAAQPCRSLDRAFDRASGGGRVQIAGGTYPTQTITGDRGSKVVFATAPSQHVEIRGDLRVLGDHVTIAGPVNVSGSLEIGALERHAMTRDVHARGVTARSSYIQSVQDVVIAHSDLAGVPGHEIVMIGAYPTSSRITFDDVKIHGNVPVDPDTHLECMFVTAIDGLTVRNSEFKDCGYFDILIGLCCGAVQQPSRLVLENNVFGVSRCFPGAGNCPSSGKAPFSLMLGTTITGSSRIIGNVFDSEPAGQSSLDHVFTSLVAADNRGDAPSGWKVRSRISATTARAGNVVHVRGQLQPARPGNLVVTYFSSAAGKVQLLSRKTVPVGGDGSYATSFRRLPKINRCSATIRLAGRQDVQLPARTLGFSC
jgi:hypothetical protein